jgi:proline dehydrogenase
MILHPTTALRASVQSLIKGISRNYIAGPTLEDAHRVSQPLVSRGYLITLGYWDSSEDTASQVLRMYLESCKELAAFAGENYLSIKIPALNYDSGMFGALRRMSRELGVALLFDALDIDNATPTLNFIAKHTDPSVSDIGWALPGRWRRSLDDADRAIDLGLTVRVVKGQSPDPAEPNRDPSEGYVNVIRKLAGRARCVRVASHDSVVARQSLRILTEAGTRCELELLYGLPVGSQVTLAREFRVPIRVYVAFGHAFLPYALSSLRARPWAILRLLRELARGDCLSTFDDLTPPTAGLPPR